jgi:hypothetical protein
MNKYSLLLVFAILLAACATQVPQGGTDGGDLGGGPVSWFDAPLPGTIVDPGSPDIGLPAVQLISHHSDPNGITEIEFSVNDEVLETNPGPPDNEALITDTRDWIPPGPGEYHLQVRAMSKTGQWSNYAETYVIVPNFEDLVVGGTVEGVVFAGLSQSPLKGCGPDQLQITASDGAFNYVGMPAGSCTLEVAKQDWGFVSYIPDAIIASSETFSTQYPIPVVSDPNTPSLLSIIMDISDPFPEQQAGFSNKSLSTDAVYNGSCSPNQVIIGVRAQHPDGIRGVTFFFRVIDPSGDATAWSNGQAMTPEANDFYAIRLTGIHLDNESGFSQATVQYQFVIEPQGGALADFVRSDVYGDLMLLACAQEPAPPPPPPPPGPTPYPCEPYPSCLVH